MIDKINANQIRDVLDSGSAKLPDPAKTPANHRPDASLQVDYASLIEKARHTSEDDDKAVQRAREMLLSGRLDNDKNIRLAAENIITFGI